LIICDNYNLFITYLKQNIMTNQKENSKNVGGTQNAANTQNPKNTNHQGAPGKNEKSSEVEDMDAVETEENSTQKDHKKPEAGHRDDTHNDPTKIKHGVNEHDKADHDGKHTQGNKK
jgi:hypothetical protein